MYVYSLSENDAMDENNTENNTAVNYFTSRFRNSDLLERVFLRVLSLMRIPNPSLLLLIIGVVKTENLFQ